jgi:dipeptidyl-peptidase-4
MKLAGKFVATVLAAAALCAHAATPRKDLTVADVIKPYGFDTPAPRMAHWMPDGNSLLYFEPGGDRMKPSDLMSLDTRTLQKSPLLSQEMFRAALKSLGGEVPEKAGFGGFTLSPKGRFLLLSSAQGTFCWDLQAKALSRLAGPEDEAENFAWSPDESHLAFTAKGSLWALDRATGKRTLLAEGKEPALLCGSVDWLYGEELDMTTGFWWSPDSAAVAYLRFDETGVPTYPIVDQAKVEASVRDQIYPKAGDKNPVVTLRVVGLADGKDAAVPEANSADGYLPRVAWLPGGKGLVYQLLNRNQDRLATFRWDLGGAASAKIMEETSPTWVNVFDAPRFLDDGRFLFLSERDGYAHVYLGTLDGKPPVQLTKGSWVVDDILGVDQKRGWVYVSGNREDPLGCQFYRADLKGTKLVRLTQGDGWHQVNLAPTSDRYVDSRSSTGTPPTVSLVEVKGGKASLLVPAATAALEEYGFVKPEFLTLKGPDGTTLYAKVSKPRDFDPAKKYPAVVEVYGGPHMQMVQDRWIGRFEVIDQLWRQNGYVTFSVDNRGSARRGKAYEDALLKRTGLHELEGQLAGLAALKALPYVDGSRVALWGWSYGGYMTIYALTHQPAGAYACGVAVAPVTDWLNYDSCYTERYLKLPKDNPEGYRDSSPVFAASGLKVPLFLAHGLVDDNVHFGNSVQMVDALFKAKARFDYAYYPRMDHGIRGPDARFDLFTRILAFFDANLKVAGTPSH